MKITSKKLEALGACPEGIQAFMSEFPNGAGFRKIVDCALKKSGCNLMYTIWLAPRIMTPTNAVRYAIFAARKVLPIYEKSYPNDDCPRKTLESAEAWLKKPCIKPVIVSYAPLYASSFTSLYAAFTIEYATRAASCAAAKCVLSVASNASYALEYAIHALPRADRAAFETEILHYAIKLNDARD